MPAHHQRILRRLRREMSLAEYLPPGHDVATSQRLAIIERFALMAERLLLDEALEDLALLAQVPQQEPLTETERRPIRRIGSFCSRRSTIAADAFAEGNGPGLRQLTRIPSLAQ